MDRKNFKRFLNYCAAFVRSNHFKNIVGCLLVLCVCCVCAYAQGSSTTTAGDASKVKGTVEAIKNYLLNDMVPLLSLIFLFVAGGFFIFDRQNGTRRGLFTIGGIMVLNLINSIYGLILNFTGSGGATP